MNIKYHIISLIFASFFLASCAKKESPTETESTKTEKGEASHEASPKNIASLTEEQMKAVGVTLGTIEMKELTATIKANGLLKVPNSNKAIVASMFGGVIGTLLIQEGNYVKKGQVIATISNPQYLQTQEQYLTVGSRITYAEQEYARQQELYNNDAGAKKNLQNASSELKTLRSQRASLAKQLQMMGINPVNLNNTSLRNGMTITAPISGTVSKITAQIGSYVDVSAPVAEIIDNGSIHLDLQVFEKDLPKMKIGQIVHFKLTNNPETEYDAKIYSIGSSFENDSKTISVHCTVTGNKTGLIDGMNITGIVSLDNSTTQAVPNQAIVQADGKYFIFVQTDERPEAHEEEGHDDHGHGHDANEAAHGHANESEAGQHAKEQARMMYFKKIEVVKGTSDMGYTAITPITDIPENTKIVVNGAFFVIAKLSNSGGHAH